MCMLCARMRARVDVLYRMTKKSLMKYLENETFKKKMFYTKIVKFRQMHQTTILI